MVNLPAVEADERDAIAPQALLLAFLGMHLLWKPIAICGASVVEAFGWVGISRSATRSHLARMTDRGLLVRHKVGRKTYFSLTEHGTAVLEDGSRKVWRGVGDADWEGLWTSVAMSVPEDSRHLRHRARSRLSWAGFGSTPSGLWVAPRRHDVASVLGPEFSAANMTVMVGRVMPPTTDAALVNSAFAIEGIAERYVAFNRRWTDCDAARIGPESAFAARMQLQAEWLSIARADPLLPSSLLPIEWPAAEAEKLFRVVDAALARASITIEAGMLDTILL